jgi:hypothetical protein
MEIQGSARTGRVVTTGELQTHTEAMNSDFDARSIHVSFALFMPTIISEL